MQVRQVRQAAGTTFAKLGFGSLSVGVAAIVVIPVYARILGPSSLGTAEVGLSIIALGGRALVLGLDGVVAIRVNEDSDRATVISAAAAVALLSGSMAWVGLVIGAILLPDAEIVRTGLAVPIAVAVFALVLNTVATATLRNLGRTDGYLRATLAYSAALIAVGVGASVAGLGAAAPLLAMATAGAAGSLTGWRAVRDLIKRPVSRPEMVGQVRLGSPLMPAAFALTALFAMDRLILGVLMTPGDVGQYAAAARIAQGLTLLTTAGLIGWLPYAMRSHRDASAAEVFAGILPTAGGLGAIAIVGAAMFGRLLLALIAGPAYVDGATSLWLLVAAIVFYAFYQIVVPGLMIARRTSTIVALTAVAATTSFVTEWLAVPPLGITGAAAGAATGTLALAILTFAWAQRRHRLPYEPRFAMVALAIAMLASVLITLTNGAAPALAAGAVVIVSVALAIRRRAAKLVGDLRANPTSAQ